MLCLIVVSPVLGANATNTTTTNTTMTNTTFTQNYLEIDTTNKNDIVPLIVLGVVTIILLIIGYFNYAGFTIMITGLMLLFGNNNIVMSVLIIFVGVLLIFKNDKG